MASVRRSIRIDRPADDVWALIGDPAALPTWFPGIEDAQVDGTSRVITTALGIPMPEEIITNDPLARRFQYRITAPLVRNHTGTIDVFDLGDGSSLVAYATDCEPDPVALIIGGACGNALTELRRQLELPGRDLARTTTRSSS
ncbi:MAG: Polyketide cyclase / dehydrase and lipid transport [Acidimicrobiales bacterium]|nr:Polyketide cyclase / dehydrase and lipid transport [Acidimicrobiales bacterium]